MWPPEFDTPALDVSLEKQVAVTPKVSVQVQAFVSESELVFIGRYICKYKECQEKCFFFINVDCCVKIIQTTMPHVCPWDYRLDSNILLEEEVAS